MIAQHNIGQRLFGKLRKISGFINFRYRYPKTRYIKIKSLGTYFSQEGQDSFLASLLFPCIHNTGELRYVLDIGCNHPEKFSNSLFFEKYFGCKTIAIDPLAKYIAAWAECRPNAIFENVAVGDEEGNVMLSVFSGDENVDDMFSCIGSPSDKTLGSSFEEHQVKMTTVQCLLDKHHLTDILFCSIDVEGFELQVLKGIDFSKTTILCFCIENNTAKHYGSDEIRDFLLSEGYVFFARIGHLDDIFIHYSLCGKALPEL